MRTTVARNQDSIDAKALFISMVLQRGSERDINDLAVRYLDQLCKAAPGDACTVQLVVELGSKTGKQDRARTYLLSMLPKVSKPADLDPKQIPLMEFIASLLIKLDDLENAEKIYRTVVAREPSKALALANFVGTYRDVDQSMEMLSAA